MAVDVKLNAKQWEAFDLLTNYDNGVSEVLYGGGARGGKCLGRDTMIRMADFSVKPVQDIAVGDYLLGDDGTPRKVLSLARGREQMYWVRQTNGMDYRVNESHILSLRYHDKKVVHTQKDYKRTYKTISNGWKVANISVRDYFKQSYKFRKEAKGYRAFEMQYDEKELPLDPYFFGLWLGDGTSREPEITLNDNDTELKEYCQNIANSFGISFKWRSKSHNQGCKTYAFSTEKKNVNNPLLDVMRSMNVINNKHIPLEYIKNSKQNRLQLLAGLLDTDGYHHNGSYEICTKYDALAEGILSLCGSLGFVTRVRDKVAMGHTYKRISIIGNNLHEIPCRLERKKCSVRKHYQNANHTGIVVEKDIVDDYYGFTIDGNHLFCLEDFTVTHNTWLGCFWQITRRLSLPGSVGFICRREYARLVDTTIKTFFEVADFLGIRDQFVFRTSSSGGKAANAAYFSNGSMIYFRYLDYDRNDPNYDRFGSYGLTDLFGDEAQELDEKAISVLRGRFSLLYGKNPDGTEWHTTPKSMYSCNPRKNWIYNDFVKPAKEGTLAEYRRFIPALPKDNPYITKDYLDNLLRSDKVTVQRLYYGNFDYDDDPTTLCDYDAISDLFHNEHVEPVGMKSASADIATKGHDRFVVYSWIGNVAYIRVDKEYSPGKQVQIDLENVLKTDGIPRSFCVVDADGVGSFVESYVTGIKEFHGGQPAKDKKYLNKRSECYFKLADLINERKIRVVVQNEDQKKALSAEIGILKQAAIDNDTGKKRVISKEEMKQLLGRSPDYMDGLMMAMDFRTKTPVATQTSGMQVKVTRH